MAALNPGTKAPEFSLSTTHGKSFSLSDNLAEAPLILAFFKISCPTCQYAFPFVERLHKAYGGKGVKIVGVSQNSKTDTALFVKEYGITFPILLDDMEKYPVSNAYGITNVPTVFWISPDGVIELSSVGWDRKDFEQLNAKAAQVAGGVPQRLFNPGEQVVAFRAG
jgi:peroxiredoxin